MNNKIVLCDNCSIKPATLICKKCSTNLCYTCDKKIHFDEELSTHKREVISYSSN